MTSKDFKIVMLIMVFFSIVVLLFGFNNIEEKPILVLGVTMVLEAFVIVLTMGFAALRYTNPKD